MAQAGQEDQSGPQKPALPEQNAHDEQRDDRDQGQRPRRASEQRVGDVTAVELAGRQQVDAGQQDAKIGSQRDGVAAENGGGLLRAQQIGQQAGQQRVAQGRAEGAEAPQRVCEHQAEDQQGQRRDEADNGAGKAHVEQLAPVADGAAHLDKRAEGAQAERNRDEVGQADLNAVPLAHEVMAHLVRGQNGHQGQRKGDADQDAGRIAQRIDAGQHRAGQCGREDSGQRQQHVQPQAGTACAGHARHGDQQITLALALEHGSKAARRKARLEHGQRAVSVGQQAAVQQNGRLFAVLRCHPVGGEHIAHVVQQLEARAGGCVVVGQIKGLFHRFGAVHRISDHLSPCYPAFVSRSASSSTVDRRAAVSRSQAPVTARW